MILIGICGPCGAGKSTVGRFLEIEYGFKLLRFAAPLKDMLRTLGLTYEQLDGQSKDQPSHLLCGQTPRHAMQTLGTEWGRKMIAPELWITVADIRLQGVIDDRPDARIAFDDLRFPNEEALIGRHGGAIWRVTGRGGEATGPGVHLSESYWHHVHADAEIDNSGTPAELSARVSVLMESMRCT